MSYTRTELQKTITDIQNDLHRLGADLNVVMQLTDGETYDALNQILSLVSAANKLSQQLLVKKEDLLEQPIN